MPGASLSMQNLQIDSWVTLLKLGDAVKSIGRPETISRAKGDQLTLITDGYDKSKPCLPRWAHGRAPKGGAFDKCPRTGMQLSAVIAHGWGCAIYLAPEHVSCGGSYTWETIFHTMSLCWKQSLMEGRSFPRSFLDLGLVCFCLWATDHPKIADAQRNC